MKVFLILTNNSQEYIECIELLGVRFRKCKTDKICLSHYLANTCDAILVLL